MEKFVKILKLQTKELKKENRKNEIITFEGRIEQKEKTENHFDKNNNLVRTVRKRSKIEDFKMKVPKSLGKRLE